MSGIESRQTTPVSDRLTQSPPPRRGIALCLTGGGYRAALFHLGALRRLHELGILTKLTTISSVSGGSIIAAHFAQCIVKAQAAGISLDAIDFEAWVAAPFRRFTSTDIRTWPLLKRFLLPWNWPQRSTQVNQLATTYQQRLTDIKLRNLPHSPNFVFCATELGCGVNWVFERTRMGQYLLGYQSPPPDWPVARAVAASSCFPPLFDPMSLGLMPSRLAGGRLEQGELRSRLVASARLSDGGVYDNLGLEPVWDTHAIVLVSDGGVPFRLEPASTILQQWKRYFGIASNQVSALRKRWLIANFEAGLMDGTYWGIGSAVSRYGRDSCPGYSKALAQDVISRIRTDLDVFSEAEACVLENHGYSLTDTAIQSHIASLQQPPTPPSVVPFGDWLEEQRVRRALASSHKRFRTL